MMEMLEPGIEDRTHFLFRIDGHARGISLRELFAEKLSPGVWHHVDEMFDELKVYTDGNRFEPVKSVFYRKVEPEETLLEIRMDNSRGLIVSMNYPCAVINENRMYIGLKHASELKTYERIPMHRRVQCFLPWDYYTGIKEHLFVRPSRKDDVGWAEYAAVKPRTLAIIQGDQKMVFTEKTKRGKRLPAFVKYTGQNKAVPVVHGMKLFRLKIKSEQRMPKLVTACGILVYS